MMDHTSSLEKQIRTLKKRSLFTLFLTWLALFFTVVGIAAGYKNFLRVNDRAKDAVLDAKLARDILPELARKDSIQTWQQQVRDQLELGRQQSAKELAELKNVSNTSAYVADTLNEQVRQLTLQQEVLKSPQKQANQWKAEEARYLLQAALRKVQLDQDPKAAQRALFLADRVLVDIGLVDFLPVRQAIAHDISFLKNSHSFDQTVLVRSIDQFSAELKVLITSGLPITNPQPHESLDEPDGRNSLFQRVQASISEVVVVRQYDQALAKRISGDAQSVRLELLRLKLENLKQLGLRQQAEAYQLQLGRINEILQQEHTDIFSDDLKAQLATLSGLLVKPDFPNLKSPGLMDTVLSGAEPAEVVQ